MVYIMTWEKLQELPFNLTANNLILSCHVINGLMQNVCNTTTNIITNNNTISNNKLFSFFSAGNVVSKELKCVEILHRLKYPS